MNECKPLPRCPTSAAPPRAQGTRTLHRNVSWIVYQPSNRGSQGLSAAMADGVGTCALLESDPPSGGAPTKCTTYYSDVATRLPSESPYPGEAKMPEPEGRLSRGGVEETDVNG
jgi:hypothetical protein